MWDITVEIGFVLQWLWKVVFGGLTRELRFHRHASSGSMPHIRGHLAVAYALPFVAAASTGSLLVQSSTPASKLIASFAVSAAVVWWWSGKRAIAARLEDAVSGWQTDEQRWDGIAVCIPREALWKGWALLLFTACLSWLITPVVAHTVRQFQGTSVRTGVDGYDRLYHQIGVDYDFCVHRCAFCADAVCGKVTYRAVYTEGYDEHDEGSELVRHLHG